MSELDTTPIGLAAASMMELLEREYPEAELKEALIVVEIHIKDEDTGEALIVRTPYYCTNESRVYQGGLLDYALDVSKTGTPHDSHEFDPRENEIDEDEIDDES